ncbi:hypothetical protein FGIG_06241 [Fasciola gigantica]|uniref:Uncharacterized protein n=1 Tax=Fasciola gigantica TaxID=46835 RepID=A0A504YNX8_FASGI|nr:hypothetical protein FGIG_06241 [Fasciola gigantica]
MTKKKNKDFQKVKIKVGRKLKRQNETIVDLTTRKIKLPREREIEKDASEKSPRNILDEAVASLDLEKSSAQLQAVQSLNRILDPFVRQTVSLTSCDSFGQTLSSANHLIQSAAIFRALFHHTTRDTELDIQLGTLLSAFHRLCRCAQDPRLGPIASFLKCHACFLSLILLPVPVQLLRIHPKFVALVGALDGCAIALLQRPESSWSWVGCELSSLVLQAHCQWASTCVLCPELPLLNMFDAPEQLVRSSVYSRALIRLNNDLRENQSIKNMSTHRTNLLHTALAFFKDHQYTIRSTLRSPTVHPWLLSRPQSISCTHLIDGSPLKVDFPLDGYSLHTVLHTSPSFFTPLDSSLLEVESPALLSNQHLGSKADYMATKKRREKSSFGFLEQVHSPLRLNQSARDQQILTEILEHGVDLLGELSVSISESLLDGLYCVLRVLRVFLESKPIVFIRYGNVTLEGRRNVSVFGTLCRFCQKLYSQCPIRPSELEVGAPISIGRPGSEHSHGSSGSHKSHFSFPPPPRPGSTKQEIRRWYKRMAKLRNRQERLHDSSVVCDEDDEDRQKNLGATPDCHESATESNNTNTFSLGSFSSNAGHTTRRAMHNHPAGLHRVNQALLDVFTLLELCQLTPLPTKPDPIVQSCWPPPEEFLQRLTSYLLDDLFPTNAVWPLVINLSWLRTFDFYLLAPVRFRQRIRSVDFIISLLSLPLAFHPINLFAIVNHRISRPVASSQRLLTDSVVTVLGRLMHGFSQLQEQWQSSGSRIPLTRNQHRLYARVAGLLTATLSIQLSQIRQIQQEPVETSGMDVDLPATDLDCEEQSINQLPVELLRHTSSSSSAVYDSVVQLLFNLVRDEAPRVVYIPPLADSTRRALGDQLEQSQTRPTSRSVPLHLVDDTWAQCLVRLYHCRFAPVLRLKTTDPTLWNRITEAEKRIDRCDRLGELSVKCGFAMPDGTFEQLGWIVSGYLPSWDGRYSSPYFWQASRATV